MSSEAASPAAAGFRQPAEWERHAAVWLAWPSHGELWLDSLADAQRELTGLCEAIAAGDEALRVLVRTPLDEQAARRALAGLEATFHRVPYGDIWLRDTAPIFLVGKGGEVGSVRFGWNGWGGKYDLPFDREVAGRLQQIASGPAFARPFVLEGGAVEVDGEGTLLTTRQCLLHPNRNPGATEPQIEGWLRDALGVERILWLDEGLVRDHTDGHVDTVARFVAPGQVVCMAPSGDDPNRQALDDIAAALGRMVDARGRRLEVHRMPSPGRVLDEDGEVMPASHANFYIANRSVVVPTYETEWDEAAVRALEPLFPGRRVVGRPSRTILEGGGAFHCITQQIPAGTA